MLKTIKTRYLLLGLMLLNVFAFILWQVSQTDRNTGLFNSVNFFLFGLFLVFFWFFLQSILSQRQELSNTIERLNEENVLLRDDIKVLKEELDQYRAPKVSAMLNSKSAERLVALIGQLKQDSSDSRGALYYILAAIAREYPICCGLVLAKKKHSDEFCVEGKYALDESYVIDAASVIQGLDSQVLTEGDAIAHIGVPADYIKAASGLGGSDKVNIYLLPLIVDGTVVGVVEIASFSNLPVVAVWNSIKDEISSLLST